MSLWRHTVLFVAVVALVWFCSDARAAGALDRIIERKTIIVAVNEDYPPQSFQEDGTWKGFDVDVARQIASRLGVSVEFVAPPWELILSGRWGGRWDVVIDSMAPTETRAKRIDFVDAYYFAPVRAAVFDDDARFQSVGDLQDAVIGVCNDCVYQKYVSGNLDILEQFASAPLLSLVGVRSLVFPDEWAAAESLAYNREVDAVVAAEPTLKGMIADDLPLRLLEGHLFVEPFAIAVQKGEFALAMRLKEIVGEMRQEGVLERLSQQWFGADYSQPLVVN